MPVSGWMTLKRDNPLDFTRESFYTDAQIMQSKLSRLDPVGNPSDTLVSCIRLRSSQGSVTGFDSIIQEVIRQIYSVRKDVEDYEQVSQVMYKVIEANLKYYRKKYIDELMEDNTRGSIDASGAERIRSNMLRMLNTVQACLDNSITDFNRREEDVVDERVVFLALFASNIESSMRFLGEYHDSSDDDDVLDVVDETADSEGEDAKQVLDSYEDEMQDVDDALAEVDEELEAL